MGSRDRRSGREKRNRRNRREKTTASLVVGSVKSVDERKLERRKTERRIPKVRQPCSHFNVVNREDGAYCMDCGGWG
jgi:hypothetical protein